MACIFVDSKKTQLSVSIPKAIGVHSFSKKKKKKEKPQNPKIPKTSNPKQAHIKLYSVYYCLFIQQPFKCQ